MGDVKHFCPDFIIAGVMKAGTTTIHHILNNHPDIFIPNSELHFWDSDDILEHPDFDYFDGNQWVQSCVTRGQQRKWYKEQFLQAAAGQIVGEDSTTYISSALFADRISQFCCNTKIVVCLRDPSDRAYSQYWHILRYGRLSLTFEKTIEKEPWKILPRGNYRLLLQNILNKIKRENVFFIILEEFKNDPESIIYELMRWLGVDPCKLPSDVITMKKNVAHLAKFVKLELFANKIFGTLLNPDYSNHFNNHRSNKISYKKIIIRLYRNINPLIARKPFIMKHVTRIKLDRFYYEQNKGLDELLNRNVSKLWYHSLQDRT